ncbi:MAG: MFS transporter, partial [Actinomycetota bacterium]|nr:MFS transporter [Actinomycetota bacterium]
MAPQTGTTTQAAVRRAGVATAVLFAGNGFLFATWVTRIPAMRDRVGAGTGALGLALLCLAVGSMLTMPATGTLCRRWG